MREPPQPSSPPPIPARLLAGLRDFGEAALDFVYPPVCLLCGAGLDSSQRAEFERQFCPRCLPGLAPEIPHACQRCGAPVGPFLETSRGCMLCRNTPFHFEKVIRLGVYRGPLQQACLAMKIFGKEPLARALAEMLWVREQPQFDRLEVNRIISVPQHWTRRLARGHNPSETIARHLAKRLKVPVNVHQVKKTRRTLDQKSLPPSRRRTNLRDAFRLQRAGAIKEQHVLLVDDVLTTGTTANRISRLLKQAGARSITIAVIALGLGDAR